MYSERFASLTDALEDRAGRYPDKLAYTFLADGESDLQELGYGQLRDRAFALAARLQQHVRPGDRVLLLCPPGLEFIEGFFGCLHAGAIAVPAFPPDPTALQRVLRRIEAIVEDCAPTVIVTTPELVAAREVLLAYAPSLGRLPLVSTAAEPAGEVFSAPLVKPDDVAFLQYTSGSTGNPKGVVLTHENLLQNMRMMKSVMPQDEDSVAVSWLPLFHDMGLIGVVLNTVFLGARCVLMAPHHFLQRPKRWLDAVTRYQATFSGSPNFGFELCLRKIGPAERATLDLSSLQIMFNGAEPIRADTLERFSREFSECGFRPEAFGPCYGLAEATLMVTGVPRSSRPNVAGFDTVALESGLAVPAHHDATARSLVSVGVPAGEQTVLIVDPDTSQPQPPGTVGEIWVAGKHIGEGYWQRPAESAAVFGAVLGSGLGPEPATGGEERYLRTGDLGFSHEGELYITGRIKDLLIVRGRNLAPQDLETVAERAHPGLRPGCGAAFQVDTDAEPLLVLVHEFDPARAGGEPGEAIRAVRDAVTTEFDVEPDAIVLIEPRTIPKTSSGKIQRSACLQAFSTDELAVVDQWDGTEATQASGELAVRIEALLRQQLARAKNLSPEAAADLKSLGQLSFDSLAAAEIRNVVEQELGVDLTLADLLEDEDLVVLSRRVADRLRPAEQPVPKTGLEAGETTTEFPLSDGQLALWYLYERDPASPAYNVPVAIRVRQPLDLSALHSALDRLVERHDILRVRFGHRGGTPYQEVLESRPIPFVFQDASAWTPDRLRTALADTANQPFDLGTEVLRTHVYRRADDDHYLLLVVHHIVTDFWSLAVLADELGALYASLVDDVPPELSAGLPAVEHRYADFVRWQAGWLGTQEAATQLGDWAAILEPLPEPLQLPTDRPRPAVQNDHGSSVLRRLPPRLTGELERFAQQSGVTVYTVLLTAFHTLLHRYTGQTDIVLGSPAAARDRSEFRDILGFFVNTLPIRLDLAGDPRFTDLLGGTRAAVFAALERQRVPFVRVVERIQPPRDAGRSPVFQVMYAHQQGSPADGLAGFALGEDGLRADLHGLAVESVSIERRSTQFDLLLMSARDGAELALSLQFNTDLFDEATAERMLGHFETLLAAALERPERRLSELELLTPAEQAELDRWNATAHDYGNVGWIHEEFACRATEQPAATALVFDGESLSYGELDARSNQLAHHLVRLGVGQNSYVGIAIDRSFELVVGLLGILKAGAAYVPFDPEYPSERLGAMLADARPDVVLTVDRHRDLLRAGAQRQVLLDTDWPMVARETSTSPEVEVSGGDAAYVIYTSGSTGQPKGVVNTHAAIRNRLAWMQSTYACGPADRVVQKTPASFDVSVWEFCWPLMTGATLVLAHPGEHRDSAALADLLVRERVTIAHFVPAMLQLFLTEPAAARCTTLRQVICSGEALPAELARTFTELLGGCRLDNLYGPTEAAVDVTAWRYDGPHESNGAAGTVPIGRPIANTSIHLLDRYGNRVPVGVPGELHIGGVALARGYHNRPELTAERFVRDPYSTVPDARLYRTGDLARYRPDGRIEFLGRIDHQVKLHGNRVELGEVEVTLAAHPAVREAIAVVHGSGADARLVAYLTGHGERVPDDVDLRAFLGQRLPQYMIPSRFVGLPELPLTPSGKLDRRAVLALEAAAADLGTGTRSGARPGAVPPRTPEEHLLSKVLGEVLGIGEVGVTDNFFELGGDSIRALQVRARARAAGLDVSIPDLLRYQTVERLAKVAQPIAAEGTESAGRVPPFGLISQADQEKLPAAVVDAYPLARLQEGLVFHSAFSPDYETYVMGFHFGGTFDQPAMRAALDRLSAWHPLLRTSFDFTTFSESMQLVHAEAVVPLVVHEVGDLPEAEQEAAISRFMREHKWRKFDWTRAPLLRVDVHRRSDRSFQCTFSHPLFDGWSMALIITELMETYGVLARGEEPPPRPLPAIGYTDFVALEREAVESPEQQRFWSGYLSGSSRAELPRWPSRRSQAPARHRRTTVTIDREVADALRRLATEAGTSLKSVVLAAHLRVVSLLAGRDDVSTGIIVNGRPEELDGERVIGVFLNTIPLRMSLSGGTWRDLVRRTLTAEREVLPYRRYPLAELVRTVGGGQQLFDTGFNYIHFHIYEALQGVAELEVLGWSSPSDQTYFPLTAYFHSDISTGELLCFLDLDDAVFDPEQVQAIQDYYRATLTAMAADPDERYETRTLLPEPERRLQQRDWNQTTVPWPSGRAQGVPARFAAAARQRPDSIAVRTEQDSLTYAELDRRSSRLARMLQRLGAGPDKLVGIALGRSVDLPVALLGVLKSGAAYVPLDPGFPRERLRHMLTDADCPIVVTDTVAAKQLPETGARLLRLDAEADTIAMERPDPLPVEPFDPDRLAYVIYTSGSTGVPKGVEINHRALDNLLLAFEKQFRWNDSDAMLAVTTLSFDIAGLELFLPLTTGARLELASESETADPGLLAARLTRSAATTMQATPATWRMLLDTGWEGAPSLRIVCGGEALTAELAEQLASRCAELWNVYGPTETTIWSAAIRLEQIDGPPPIGRPLANTTFHVLDCHGQPVPVGTPGELYIGGLGLARGYRNRPDLTARAFVRLDPGTGTAERLYRTGDLVRYRPDGVLEYLGRLDSQVKVRGYRIELGEVESVLGRLPQLKQAVVLARRDGAEEARLVAYVVPRSGGDVEMRALREAVAAELPVYMVPSVFLVLEELPHTPNGKVDRKALPAPTGERPALGAAFSPPGTPAEVTIATIWQELLHVDRVGVDDSFFDLGGHSLLMVRMQSRIREQLADIPLLTLFEHPTVRGIAQYLAREVQGERRAGDLEQVRARAQRRKARRSRTEGES
jgi:amino acid adenylation domain-containing protein